MWNSQPSFLNAVSKRPEARSIFTWGEALGSSLRTIKGEGPPYAFRKTRLPVSTDPTGYTDCMFGKTLLSATAGFTALLACGQIHAQPAPAPPSVQADAIYYDGYILTGQTLTSLPEHVTGTGRPRWPGERHRQRRHCP